MHWQFYPEKKNLCKRDTLQRNINEKFISVSTTDLKGLIVRFQYENPSTKIHSNLRRIGILPLSTL